MVDESKIAQLIVQQLCGTISGEGKKELTQWIDESPAHRRFMETRMQREMLNRGASRLLDMDRAAIRKRFDQLRTANLILSRRRRIERWKIIRNCITTAAAIAGFSLVPSIRSKFSYPPNYTTFRTQKIIDTIAKQENIKVARMTLTLSNGADIVIDTNTGPKYESGYRIVNEEEGYIAYVRYNSKPSPSDPIDTYNTLTTPQNAHSAILVMPDGTITGISPGSSLRYPLVSQETNGSRVVTLHGEAIFNISSNPNAPFVVETKRLEALALGTAVKIRDYDSEDSARVSALSGQVEVRNGMNKTTLLTGQGVIVGESLPTLKFFSEVVSMPELIRRSGMFRFTNRTTSSIMREIARWYGMDAPRFINVDTTITGQLGSGVLPKSLPLDSLLNIISTEHIHFDINGESILVHQ